ncbi:hypothetical protein ACO22_03521 [Paracoccidioides brasiliensis]|uniref:Sugar phosphate transporter domain-containing protein n=1 Tax=Paracoccidioides brasiliensis TaxID=121759 RepID=A0A1D2JFS1_PARBR|nr:hypothetical protein ACO22_03521 [Paracoccidioides brasiliensis]
MSTTTLINTAQRSTLLSPILQLPIPTTMLSSSASVAASVSQQSPLDKFPVFEDEPSVSTPSSTTTYQTPFSDNLAPLPSHLSQPLRSSHHQQQQQQQQQYQPPRWAPRKHPSILSIDTSSSTGSKQRPRKSISEAIGGFRNRGTSVSANAQELAEALKAPVSYKLIILCIIWYTTSALTNTSSKSILTTLPKPITLTIIQFAFVSFWCFMLASLASIFPSLRRAVPPLKNGLRKPSRIVIKTALPLAIFSLLGHILSSMATSQIPVSLVHTIKGLSPLFTVVAYRCIFRIKYAMATYLSLIPLTAGVMLACSSGFSTNLLGILCAFSAAIVFVSQNIFSKKLFNKAARAEAEDHHHYRNKNTSANLDKLNLLYYCAALAFLLTLPIWFVSEGYTLLSDLLRTATIPLPTDNKSSSTEPLETGPLLLQFLFNGLSHFAQNIFAFSILSMVSPVSYSVASLLKRVVVIVATIVWFGSPTNPVQAIGIGLTFLGLYLYDRNSHDDAADRRARDDRFHGGDVEGAGKKSPLLPLSNVAGVGSVGVGSAANGGKAWDSNGYSFSMVGPRRGEHPAAKAPPVNNVTKKVDGAGAGASAGWLLPGTKQESTWKEGDSRALS